MSDSVPQAQSDAATADPICTLCGSALRKKPHLVLHAAPMYDPPPGKPVPEKHLWYWITLPDGRNTTRCRSPREVFERSKRLRAFLLDWKFERIDHHGNPLK